MTPRANLVTVMRVFVITRTKANASASSVTCSEFFSKKKTQTGFLNGPQIFRLLLNYVDPKHEKLMLTSRLVQYLMILVNILRCSTFTYIFLRGSYTHRFSSGFQFPNSKFIQLFCFHISTDIFGSQLMNPPWLSCAYAHKGCTRYFHKQKREGVLDMLSI